MVLLRSLITTISVATLAHCQSAAAPIDPQDIDEGIREQWCIDQTASCPLLCFQMHAGENPVSNSCDKDTLQYSCVCGNNQSPNASEYSQTIPYYLCTERNNRCVAACAQGDSSCQTECRTSNPCGAQNPKKINVTSTAATTPTNTHTSTETSLAPFTGLPNDDNAAPALGDMSQVYGLFAVLGAFSAGFAILL
ncbi:hypothetical protein BJX61DRAFT_303408 [Aspergillus egyptiacus]|nr:hypothetical protein BJX61DRAFT_303408 [Aspergillus egyptiacus]